MKILIDTEKKTVRLEEAVCFGELYKLLKQLFPEDFRDWKVEAQPQIQWVYPHNTYTTTKFTWPEGLEAPTPMYEPWQSPTILPPDANPYTINGPTCGNFPN